MHTVTYKKDRQMYEMYTQMDTDTHTQYYDLVNSKPVL